MTVSYKAKTSNMRFWTPKNPKTNEKFLRTMRIFDTRPVAARAEAARAVGWAKHRRNTKGRRKERVGTCAAGLSSQENRRVAARSSPQLAEGETLARPSTLTPWNSSFPWCRGSGQNCMTNSSSVALWAPPTLGVSTLCLLTGQEF